ncbi:MAG TPA: NAD(P) transhydrogenase subunit alpha [Myxococcota bacterium]|nr:NAD(P) transhydrogenase subunit alpha [Myxococcota bacterium]HOS60866.1 NAD(P) transhydrogenase subunit alpha [Myxococcota bacterium]HPL24010.1 NAD(P) transhydrogenase subunit alpha [Myxococcota bacterium]
MLFPLFEGPAAAWNFWIMLLIFIVALVIGVFLIGRVPPLLHTPLMSMTNAISGITIVGSLVAAQYCTPDAKSILGFLAVIMATINVMGGYAVTDRMMKMFKTPGKAGKEEEHD